MKRFAVLLTNCTLFVAGCSRLEEERWQMAGGEPQRGKAAIARYGCGSCHTIPGIRGANALVGPSLEHIASRTYIAGVLQNTRANMLQWIKNPPQVDEKTAMPNLRVTDEDARAIAAYLYTLR